LALLVSDNVSSSTAHTDDHDALSQKLASVPDDEQTSIGVKDLKQIIRI
jgi:hypothetical protein